MTRPVILIAAPFWLCISLARADQVHWKNGGIWADVTVSEVRLTTGDLLVYIAESKDAKKTAWYGGAVRVVIERQAVRPTMPQATPLPIPRANVQQPMAHVSVSVIPPVVSLGPSGPLGIEDPRMRQKASKLRQQQPTRRNGAPGLYKIEGIVKNIGPVPIASIELEIEVLRDGASLGFYPYQLQSIPVGHSKSFAVDLGYLQGGSISARPRVLDCH